MVAQESAFDEGGDVFLLVVGELVEGFELEAQAGVAGPHVSEGEMSDEEERPNKEYVGSSGSATALAFDCVSSRRLLSKHVRLSSTSTAKGT